MFRVKSLVLTAALVSYTDAAGCYPTWRSGADYNPGDLASKSTTVSGVTTTYNYECKASPYNLFCGQAGYEPGATTNYWTVAWTKLSACTGTEPTTTTTTTSTTTTTIAAWSGGGCPSAYVAGTAYDEGALVENNGAVFQCKVRPDLIRNFLGCLSSITCIREF